MFKNTKLFKEYRKKFTEKHPSGTDDGKAPEFYGNIIEAFNFNAKNENIAFIVVAHFVHSLPYFLEALSSIGDIAVLISKQSGVVKKVHKTISEIYNDLIVKDINKENLNNNPILTLQFLAENLKKWENHKFIILDHGGYFAPRINDVLPKFSHRILGVVEHTWNGEVKYKEKLKLQPFPFPVLSIAHSDLKKLESESVARSIVDAVTVKMAGEGLNQDITRLKNILIIGYGNIGKCIAKTLKQRLEKDQTIYICDNTEERLLEAENDGFLPNVTKDKHKFLQNADLIITATSSQALMEEHFLKLKKNVVIVCATSSDDQFDKNALEKYDNFLPKNEKEKHKKIIQKQPCVKYQHLEDKEKIFYLFANGDSANFLIGSTPHPIIHLIMSSIYVNTGRLLINHYELSSNEIHLSQKNDDSLIKEIWEETYGPVWGVLRQELEHLAWGFRQLFGNKLVPEKINKAIFNYIQKAKLDPSRQALEIIVSHLELIKQQQRRLKGDITASLLDSLIFSSKETLKQDINISEEKKTLLSRNTLPTIKEKHFEKLLSEQEQLEDNKLFLPLLTEAWCRAVTEGRASKKVVLFCSQQKFFIKLVEHLQTAGINTFLWKKESEHTKIDFYLEIEIEENRPILALKNAKETVRHGLNNYLSILQWLITIVFGAGEEYIKWFENELTVSHFNAFESVPILPPNLFKRDTLLNEIVQKFDEQELSQRQVIINGENKTGKTILALLFCYEQYRKYYNEVIWVEGTQLKKILRNINFEEKTNCLLVINDVCSYEEIEDHLPNGNIDILVITYDSKKAGLQYVQVNNLSIEEAKCFIIQRLGSRNIDTSEYFDLLIKCVGLKISDLKNAVDFIKQNCISIPRFLSLHNVKNMSDEKLKLEINSFSALAPTKKNDSMETLEFENNENIIFQPEQRQRPWHLPKQNPNFTGRRAVLRDIRNKLKINPLTQCNPVTLTACEGLGGMGKTQIAIEYAYRNIKHYRLICWIPAQDKNSIEQAYFELIDHLKINVSREDAVEKKIEAVKNYFQNNQSNLLIFDDAKDYETIKPYIPELGSAILVTSRYKDINWQHTLEVKEFTLKEAMKYVKKILQIENNNQDRLIEKLCETMGCLPLALAQATAYIWEEKISISEYLEIYHTNKSILSNTAMPVGGKHVPVYVTYCLAIEAIKKQSSYAAELINYCAFLENNNIPGFFLESVKHERGEQKEIIYEPNKKIFVLDRSINNNESEDSFETALGFLQRYSLITINEDNYQFSLHQLLQVIIKQQILLQSDIKLKAMRNLLWAFAAHLLSNKQETTFHITILMSRRILLPHVKAFLQYDPNLVIPECKEDIIQQFLWAIAETYLHIGSYEMAKLALENLKLQSIVFEDNDMVELVENIEYKLSRVFSGKIRELDCSQVDKQEQLLKRLENENGRKSEPVARALNELGVLFVRTDPKRALNYFLEAKDILLNSYSFSMSDQSILFLERNMADAYCILEDREKEYHILKDILPKYNLMFGEESCITVQILFKLGHASWFLFKSKEGIKYLENAKSLTEKFYKDQDKLSMLAEIYIALGNAYRELNQLDKACDLLEKALKIVKKQYKDTHIRVLDLAKSILVLACSYNKLGEKQKGCRLLEETLPILKQHADQHKLVISGSKALAWNYVELEQYGKALLHLEQVYLIYKEKRGHEHPKTQKALNEFYDLKLDVEDMLKEENSFHQANALGNFGIFNNSNISNNALTIEKNNNIKIDREEVYFKLTDNIDRITDLISPLVQEALISDELFINYLKQSEHLENSLSWEQIFESSEELANSPKIIAAYLCYHVLDDKQELHENVLQAIEGLQNNFQHN